MGMAASQSRFLTLTARKSNVEYQGQQINQERTMLANESSNIYAQLSNMEVPTPPNTHDFYKPVYNFTATELSGTGKVTQYVLDEIINTPDGPKAYVTASSSYFAAHAASGSKNITESTTKFEDAKKSLPSTYSDEKNWTGMKVTGGGTDTYLLKASAKDLSADLEVLANKEVGGNEIFSVYFNQDGTLKDENAQVYFYMDGNKKCYLDPRIATQNTNGTTSFNDSYATASYSVGENKTSKKNVYDVKSYNQNDIGRYTDMTIEYYPVMPDGTEDKTKDKKEVTYNLSYTKVEDEEAYKAAMQDYEYEKAKYEKAVSDLNGKTEIIQNDDKTLELELKQLDTEQNAIKTEMDAVTKVVEDNVESTFKTFG